MADLQSCFFCGTADEVQEYAVVPPRYTDDSDPQVAVLCEQCKGKLLQVIEPLVDRLESADGEATTQANSNGTDAPANDASSGQASAANRSGEDITMTPGGPTGGKGTPEQAEQPNDTATSGGGPGATVGGDATGEQPPNYRRAMRMLSNREFPLERSEVESMLAGAYDMETHELEAVLSHAVETGRLVEENGAFHEPDA